MFKITKWKFWTPVISIVSAAILGLMIGGISSQIESEPLTSYEEEYYHAYEVFDRSDKNYSDLLRIKDAEKVLESHLVQDTEREAAIRKRNARWSELSFISMAVCLVLGFAVAWKAAGALSALLTAAAYYLSGSAFFMGGPSTGIATGTIPLINGAVTLLIVFGFSHFFLRRIRDESQ